MEKRVREKKNRRKNNQKKIKKERKRKEKSLGSKLVVGEESTGGDKHESPQKKLCGGQGEGKSKMTLRHLFSPEWEWMRI